MGLCLFKQGSNLRSNVEGDRERHVGGIVTRALGKGVGVVFTAAISQSPSGCIKIPVALIFLVACC
jgi:hypothetical protein